MVIKLNVAWLLRGKLAVSKHLLLGIAFSIST
jgi:hypothetical protein